MNTDKVELFRSYLMLEGVRDRDVVLCTDAYDVLILSTALEIYARFVETGADILFNGENNFFPSDGRESVRDVFDRSASPNRYLNAGCYVGYAWAIRRMLDWTTAKNAATGGRYVSDQHLVQDCYVAFRVSPDIRVQVDEERGVFGSLFQVEDEYQTHRGVVTASGRRAIPILHANGNKQNVDIIDNLFDLFMSTGSRALTDLRIVRLALSSVRLNEHDRLEIEGPDRLGEQSVLAFGIGNTSFILFTPEKGPLTFLDGGRIATGAEKVAAGETLNRSELLLSAHGTALSDYITDVNDGLQLCPLPVLALRGDAGKRIVHWAHWIERSIA